MFVLVFLNEKDYQNLIKCKLASFKKHEIGPLE